MRQNDLYSGKFTSSCLSVLELNLIKEFQGGIKVNVSRETQIMKNCTLVGRFIWHNEEG